MYGNISNCKKFIHFLLIVPVYIIVFIVVFTFNSEIVFDIHGVTIPKLIFVPLFEFFAIMTIICHIRATFIDPGKIIEELIPKEVEFESHKQDLYCKRCNIKRPERAHHCKTCQRCVLKMDHHCPWIANCVGYYNQKFFFQFVFYATIGDFIAFCYLGVKLFHADFNVPANSKLNSVYELIRVMWSPLSILIGTVLSLAMTISIGSLLYAQYYLISRNITSVEQAIYSVPEDNIYYSADTFHNFKIVLGYSWYEWLFPIFAPNVYNNGYDFALNRGRTSLRLPTKDKPDIVQKVGYLPLEEYSNNIQMTHSINSSH